MRFTSLLLCIVLQHNSVRRLMLRLVGFGSTHSFYHP